jgi:hypothetical protein
MCYKVAGAAFCGDRVMKRPILLLVGTLLLAVPALGQDSALPLGRYQIAPDADGFVRLDTRTGALTHCGKRDGAWRCDVLAEERSDLVERVAALRDEMASLTAGLDRLASRLSTIEDKLGAPAAAPPSTAAPLVDGDEKELDEALSFAERLMKRFFELVKELKSEEPPTRT